MPTKDHSKKIISLLLMLVFFSAVFYIYKKNLGGQLLGQKGQKNFTQNSNSAPQNINTNSQITSSEQDVVEGTLESDNSNSIEPADGQRSPEKPDEALRQSIISYINKKLNELVPPPAKDQWDIPIFYFVGNSQVYLELYGVDTDLVGLKLLYRVTKEGNNFKLEEEARYKESKDDFVLASGKDDFRDYVKEEYDYNEDTSQWEKVDEFTESDNTDNFNENTSFSNAIVK